jgi:hypothetical protein
MAKAECQWKVTDQGPGAQSIGAQPTAHQGKQQSANQEVLTAFTREAPPIVIACGQVHINYGIVIDELVSVKSAI